jgi:hypothetical protein
VPRADERQSSTDVEFRFKDVIQEMEATDTKELE